MPSSHPVSSDRYDATIGPPAFVVHRDQAAHWAICDLVNSDYDILAWALSGRAHYCCGGEKFTAERGQMLWFPRGTAHSATSDAHSPWSFFSVGFRVDPTSDSASKAFSALPCHVMLSNLTQISDYFHQLHRLWTARETGFLMACRGLILLLMQQYVSAAERARRVIPHAARLDSLMTYLHSNVGVVYSVGELADRANLSESRFRALFSQMAGCSVTRYQNRLRVQAAKDMLASGHYSVSAVADELGFNDVYYFSRLFKRFTGLPPSAFSKR